MATTDDTSVAQIAAGAYSQGSQDDQNISVPETERGGHLPGYNHTSMSFLTEADYAIPVYMLVTVTLLYSVFFVLGLVGNSLVVFVISVNAHMRNSTNRFLLNLSVADMLVLAICMPASLTEFLSKDVWLLGDFMCKIVPYLEHSVANASVLTILCITIERYFAICFPMKAKSRCIGAKTGRAIALVWACALVVALPFLAMSQTEMAIFYDGSNVVVCRTAIDNVAKQTYVVALMVLFFVVPLTAVGALYAAIILRMRVSACDITIQRQMRMSSIAFSRLHGSRRQVIYMLVAIVILFIISLLPIRVVTLWYIFSPDQHKTSLGLEGYLNILCFSRIMFYMNSAVNPVLYNIMSSRFRESFRCAISKEYRSSHRGSTASTFYSLLYTRDSAVAFRRRSCDAVMLHVTTCRNRQLVSCSENETSRAMYEFRRSSVSSCTAREHRMFTRRDFCSIDKISIKPKLCRIDSADA